MSETVTPPAPQLPSPLPTNQFRRQALSLLNAGGTSNFTNPVSSSLNSTLGALPRLSNQIQSYINNSISGTIPSDVLAQLNEFKTMINTGGAFLNSITGFLNTTNIASGVSPGTAELPGLSARMGFASAGMRLDATTGEGGNPCGAVGKLFASILEGVHQAEEIANYILNIANQSIEFIIQSISNIINYVNQQIQALTDLVQREINAVLSYAEKIANAALNSALEDLLGNECTTGIVNVITNPQIVNLLQQSRALGR